MTTQEDSTTPHDTILSPEQMASIYPTAKTYDEKLNERHQREQNKPKINLHKLTFSVAMRTFTLLALLLLIVAILVPGVLALGVFSGVFFTFLLALIWMSTAWWQLSAVAKPFYLTGLNLTVFILVYCVVASPLAYGILSLSILGLDVFVLLLMATITHFGLCYIIMAYMIRSGQQAHQS